MPRVGIACCGGKLEGEERGVRRGSTVSLVGTRWYLSGCGAGSFGGEDRG